MAQIYIRNSGKRLESEQEVRSFLKEQGVLFEQWPTEKLPQHLREKFVLNEEEQEEILKAYQEEIQSLAKRNGYVQWDVVALSEATENLEELLKKFENVHTHSEDEVRAIVSGNGIFTIKGKDGTGYFDVELSPGDVISVSENTPHFFTLMKNRKVVAVRLFIDPSGWVAHPYQDPEFTA
ncbi:acireductone dioxygenase [Thermoactinomyces sp. CICC 24227]|uniref:1,2-dihydroxy-3-keto-5-methylthiopentene dioxygenase n=1 Tax=Thermoactinomyces sp. CICC 24227 TaxID=2767432 RepID=UPI0018DB256B|nr:cupin domain-containing protein [Thermoactinomyces sp. CICC 24227]MBI0387557.1 cupin domain-containing protein [Thermoactinomyces sp. CICC 24227]